MGQELFYQLTAPGSGRAIPLIRVQDYLQLIESQDWPEERIVRRKNQVNQNYSRWYPHWQASLQNLYKQYNQAAAQGAAFEYLETRYFPADGLQNTYEVETSFLFRSAEVQSEVILSYQMAWLPGTGLRAMSRVTESF
jgi:hypothetical protein